MLECINSKPLIGNEIAPPLTVGEKYELKQVIKCGCGLKHYDVGLKSDYSYVSCRQCSEHLIDGDTIHWCSPDRFIKNE
jgi:hypothetical protein